MRQNFRRFTRRCISISALLAGISIQSPELWAQWTPSGNDIYNSNSGNVGIGTSTPNPNAKLDVVGWISALGGVGSGGSSGGFLASDRTSSGFTVYYRDGGVNRLWDSTAGDVIAFDSNGKVGIGTTNPSTALHVVGDVTVTGNISAK